VGLAPLKAVERGAQSTPRSASPRSLPPLTREEEERPREGAEQGSREKTPEPQAEEVEALRSQEPKGMVLALGAIPPFRDVDLGVRQGPARPRWVTSRWPLTRHPRQGPTEKAWSNQRPPGEKDGTSRHGAKPR
jgi:hypothetical protein